MKKIKAIVNDRLIAFDFKANILNNNVLFKICKGLNLSEVYIDLFKIGSIEMDFSKELIKENISLSISSIEQGGLAIKVNVKDIPIVIEKLSRGYYELNVWDIYTDWDQYLKDKTIFKAVPQGLKSKEPKVYLNYNQLEGNKVELYLDLSYNVEKIHNKLEEIIRQK